MSVPCPACTAKHVHATEDWAHHPYAGHGYASGQGWTHPDLAPAQHNGAVSLKLTEMEQGLLAKGLDPDLAHETQAGAAASLRSGEGGDGTAPVGGKA